MNEENKEQCCKKAHWIVSVVALVLSLATFIMVGIMLYNTDGKLLTQSSRPVVISQQYDKGQNYEKALATEKPMVIWFYTDWCHYCQSFAPTFGKIVKDKGVKKNFAIAYVKADNPENQKLVQEYQVQGFPTVYLVDAKAGKKTQIDNSKMFTADAKKELVEDFMEFIGKDKD